MKVEQFMNKNQFHLYGENEDLLQSYNSLVVKILNKGYYQKIILGKDWDYSNTTSRHVYAFLDDYSKVRIYGITNKRKYINDLIEECRKDSYEFLKKYNYKIEYDEEME